MDQKPAKQHSQTLGIIGFIALIPVAISWLLFILFISKISILFQVVYRVVPFLIMVFFTINPIIAFVLGVLSIIRESRNIYAYIARTGGLVFMGFLLIAIFFR
ncbi:MAG: hypothetical protein JW794_08815 [Candidatus Cloacimonetes bacterium]|nr:hypothetical protein [Candidatus Cloacimonadota bacterium]